MTAPEPTRTARRVAVLVVACGFLIAACGIDDQADTRGPPGTGNPGQQWGPLAVVPGGGSGNEALIIGTLRVTDDCVFVEERGDDVLLVWPADRTTWNDEEKSIEFLQSSGESIHLAHGDQVRISGGGSSVDEGGLEADDWLASIQWTSEPPGPCVKDTRWFVGDLLNPDRSTDD